MLLRTTATPTPGTARAEITVTVLCDQCGRRIDDARYAICAAEGVSVAAPWAAQADTVLLHGSCFVPWLAASHRTGKQIAIADVEAFARSLCERLNLPPMFVMRPARMEC